MELIPEDQGHILVLAGAGVGPGLHITKTQTNRTRWRILSVTAKFVTDGTVGNRFVFLSINLSTTVFMRFMSQTVQTPTQTIVYTWSPGVGANLIANNEFGVVSMGTNVLLNNSMQIIVNATNIQPGDQFFDLDILVEEWTEPLT